MGWRVAILLAFAGSFELGQSGPGEVEQVKRWMWDAARLLGDGQAKAAQSSVEMALKELKRTGGDERVEALALNNLGLIERDLGQYSKAERRLLRSIALIERAGSGRDLLLVTVLNNLALVYQDQNQPGRAERCLRRALEIIEGSEERSGFDEATTLNALAVSLLQQRRQEEGQALLERALAAWERVPDGPEVLKSRATCRLNTAAAHASAGRWKDAVREQASALATLERLMPPAHPEFIKALTIQGQILAGAGDLKAAEQVLHRASELAKTHLAGNALMRGHALSTYAGVLQRLGRKQEAKAVASEAKAALSAADRSAFTRQTVDYSDLVRAAQGQ